MYPVAPVSKMRGGVLEVSDVMLTGWLISEVVHKLSIQQGIKASN